MPEVLRSLTIRGRAFLAAGIAAAVCGMLIGERLLVEVGVLLFLLPLITAIVVSRGRYQLALVRTVAPQTVAAGQPARVELALTNDGWMPAGALLMEETLPYSLGSRPRFVVRRMRHGWRTAVGYQVRSDVRGRFDIGPMTVRVADPFGLVELSRTFTSTAPLIVTPRIVPLPPTFLTAGQSTAGDARPRSFASGSAEDVTVREYRRGDDLRRVHWRSSARIGELMVRREEQPWQARATVFLDNRAHVHRGAGAASSFETAVVAAASVVVHLEQRGYAVRLATATGDVVTTRTGVHEMDHLLESLASVQLVESSVVDPAWAGDAGSGGLTFAVLGAVDEPVMAVLRRARHHADNVLGIVLDVAAWGGSPHGAITGATAAPALILQGWKIGVLHPEDRIDGLWGQLGGRGGPAGPVSPAAPAAARVAAPPSGQVRA
jgi:uncharacterized protein (DUF58 family)